jgi:hypothetical protein
MPARVIQVRPSRNPRWQKQAGWEVFEAEGVSPVYCGENAHESALSYVRQRVGYAPRETHAGCRVERSGSHRAGTVRGVV